jgi:hypothetical protein
MSGLRDTLPSSIYKTVKQKTHSFCKEKKEEQEEEERKKPKFSRSYSLPNLRQYQRCGVLARLHAGPSDLPDFLTQLGRVTRLSHVYQQVPELCHFTVYLQY